MPGEVRQEAAIFSSVVSTQASAASVSFCGVGVFNDAPGLRCASARVCWARRQACQAALSGRVSMLA